MNSSAVSWDAPASPDPSPASPDPEPGSISEYMPWKSVKVDVPLKYFPYRPNPTGNLPTLLETVLVPVRDPRLVKDLPNESVYQIVRKFFSSKLAAALNCDRTRDPRLKERLILVNNKSDGSSGEEDWYHEKIEGKPRRLKICIHLKRLKWLSQTSYVEPARIVYSIAEPGQSPERIENDELDQNIIQDKASDKQKSHKDQEKDDQGQFGISSTIPNTIKEKPKEYKKEIISKEVGEISVKSKETKLEKISQPHTKKVSITELSIKDTDESKEKISPHLEAEKHKKHKKPKKQKKVKHKKKRSPSPTSVSKEKLNEQSISIVSTAKETLIPTNEADPLVTISSLEPKPEDIKEEKELSQPCKPLNIKDLKAVTERVKKKIQVGESDKTKKTEDLDAFKQNESNKPYKKKTEKVELVAYPRMYQDPRLREKMKTAEREKTKMAEREVQMVEPVPPVVAEVERDIFKAVEPVPPVTAQTTKLGSIFPEREESIRHSRDPRLGARKKSDEKKFVDIDASAKRKFLEVRREAEQKKDAEIELPIKPVYKPVIEEPPARHIGSTEKKSTKTSRHRKSSKEYRSMMEKIQEPSKSHETKEAISKETQKVDPSPIDLPEKSVPCSKSPTSRIFSPLSGFVQKMCDKVDPKINERIDIIVKSTQDKVTDSLDKVVCGKKCDALEFTPKFRHFPPLSLSTQLESSMLSYPSVQKIVGEEMMLWMKEKPLDMYILGKQTEHFKFNPNNNIIKASPRTDDTVNQAIDDFNADVYEMMKEETTACPPQKKSNNGLPKPKCKTDETVHQVYRQVTQYLDFLASKELSTSKGTIIDSSLFDSTTKLQDSKEPEKFGKPAKAKEDVTPKKDDKSKLDKKEDKKDKSRKEKHRKKEKDTKKKEDREKRSKDKDSKDKEKHTEKSPSSGLKEGKVKKEDSSKKGRWDSDSKHSTVKSKSQIEDSSRSKVLHVTNTVKKKDKPKVAISLYDPHEPTDEEDSSGRPSSPIPYQLKTLPEVVKSTSTSEKKSHSSLAATIDKHRRDHKSRNGWKAVTSDPKVKIDINKAKSSIKDACETVVLDPLAENLEPNFDPLFDIRNLKCVDSEKNPWDIAHYYQRKYKEYVQYINERKFPSKDDMNVDECEGSFAFAYMKSLAQGKKSSHTKPSFSVTEVKSETEDVNEYGTNVNEYGSNWSDTSKPSHLPGLPRQVSGEEIKSPNKSSPDSKEKSNEKGLSVENAEKRATSPKSPRGFEPVAMSPKDKVSIAPKIKLVVSSASKLKTTSSTSTSSTVKSNSKPKIAKSGNWLVRSFQQAVQAKQKIEESAVTSKANDKGRLSALQKLKLKKDAEKSPSIESPEGEPEVKKMLMSNDSPDMDTLPSTGDISSENNTNTSPSTEVSGRTLFRHSFKRDASNEKEKSPAKKPRLSSADYVPPPPADIPQPNEPQEDIDLSEVLEMTIERSPVRIESITREVPDQPLPPEPELDGRTTPVMDDIPLPPPGGHDTSESDPNGTMATLQAQAITYSQDPQQYYSQEATTQGAAVAYATQEQHTAKPPEQLQQSNFDFQPDIPQPDESYSHIAQQAQEWSQWQAVHQSGQHQPNWQWDHVSQQWVDYNAYYQQWNTSQNYNYMPTYDASQYPHQQWPQQASTHQTQQTGWEGWNQPPELNPPVQTNTTIPSVGDTAPGTEPTSGVATEEETYDENAEEGYTTGAMNEREKGMDGKLKGEGAKEHEEQFTQYYYQQQQQSQPAFIPTQPILDQDKMQQSNKPCATTQNSGDIWRSPPTGSSTGQQNNLRGPGPPPPGVGLLPHPNQFRGQAPANRFQGSFDSGGRPPFDPRFAPPPRFQGTWGIFRKVELQPDEDPNQAPARHVRMYVFNKDQSICKSILRFLDFMGAKEFDPYNVQLLRALNDNEVMVYIHNQDIAIMNNIPNLLRLKENPKVKFVAYENVFEVKQKKYNPILIKGGIVVPDDQIMLEINPDNLKTMCEFMESRKLNDEPWLFKINESVFRRLEELIKTSKDQILERLEKVKKMLDDYSDKQIIETMTSEQEPVVKPAPEYMSTLINLQASQAFQYRHIFFLTNMPAACIEASALQAQGISVVNPACFITYVTDKEPARDMKPQFFNYGLRGSPMFSDLYRSSAIDTITFDNSEEVSPNFEQPQKTPDTVEPEKPPSQPPAPPPPQPPPPPPPPLMDLPTS